MSGRGEMVASGDCVGHQKENFSAQGPPTAVLALFLPVSLQRLPRSVPMSPLISSPLIIARACGFFTDQQRFVAQCWGSQRKATLSQTPCGARYCLTRTSGVRGLYMMATPLEHTL